MNQIRLYQAVVTLMAWATVTLAATMLAAFSAPYTERATAPFVDVWLPGPLGLAGDPQCANAARDFACTVKQ